MPVDPGSFSCDNSNVSHSFYKKLGNTFLKSYYWHEVHLPGDKGWMGTIELIFEMSLWDCTGHCNHSMLSCSPASPWCSQLLFHPRLSLGNLLKKRKDMIFMSFWIYLWNSFDHYKCEYYTLLTIHWIIKCLRVRRDLDDQFSFTLRTRWAIGSNITCQWVGRKAWIVNLHSILYTTGAQSVLAEFIWIGIYSLRC